VIGTSGLLFRKAYFQTVIFVLTGGTTVGISDISFGVDIGPFFSDKRSFSSVAKVAIEIERLGFDSVWIPDHEVDPLATLSFIAAKTSRIKLGTCVLIPDHRNPVLLARQISALDNLSNGRIILGLGAGEGREMFGTPIDRPVARLLETIKILKELWKCTKVTYRGDFWEIRDYSLELKPLQKPHPPIWTGASGPRMLKITAKHGNGCFGPQLTSKHYKEWLNKLRNATEEAGRNPDEIMPAHLPFTSISKDHEAAVKSLEPHVKWFLVWASQPLGLLPQELGYEGKWEKEEDVPREAVERCFIVGTPKECIKKMEEFVHSGVRYFVLAVHAPDEKNYFQSLKLYAKEVLPHFKEVTV
jgi:alkanesulfonate monooxygenase SsuD/methylene tetrahydromethanopterin reductase-like flavin-dependent oxidoreductase (luciferase family)